MRCTHQVALASWLLLVAGVQIATQRRSVLEGVYTNEQALRGQRQYDISCVRCHGPDLEGGGPDVPGLADKRFIETWAGRPLSEMFELIRLTMPENAPGSLDAASYADLLAYVLQANGLPEGPSPLEPGHSAFDSIVFEEPTLR